MGNQAMPYRSGLLSLLLLLPSTLLAGTVEIVFTELRQAGDEWQPTVTLRHADTGWDHYADAWRVVTRDGTVLSHRTLYHPHVDEQPFTRSGPGFTLPEDAANQVFVEAHDTVHGWSPERLEIDMTQPTGPRWKTRGAR